MFSTSMETTFNPRAARGGIASLPSFYFVMEVLHVVFSYQSACLLLPKSNLAREIFT